MEIFQIIEAKQTKRREDERRNISSRKFIISIIADFAETQYFFHDSIVY